MASGDRVEELPRRAAGCVFQNLRAIEDVCLLGIIFRHGHAPGGEPFVHRGEDVIVAAQTYSERGRDRFPRQVIFGRTKPAGEDNDVGARDSGFRCVGQMLEVVADDGFEGDLHAQLIEPRREIERIGVLPEGGQHLRTGGDDICDHTSCLPSMPSETW